MSWLFPRQQLTTLSIGGGTAPRAATDERLLRTNEGWTMLGGGAAEAFVNASTAMQLAAVYMCVRLLAETTASLPLNIYRMTGEEGDRELERRHPLYSVLHSRPNRWQTSFEWREMMMGHLVLRGNCYSQKLYRDGLVEQLIPLHPDRVRAMQLDNYSMTYEYRDKLGRPQTFMQDDIFHVKGFSDDGLIGMNPAYTQRETLAGALGVERYGSSMYSNGAQLGGILKKKGGALSPVARQNLEDGLKRFSGSRNAFKTMVLEDDLEWTQIGMRARDAEYMAARKFSKRDIAGLFHIPPHMIGDLEQATFSNIEHQGIEFVVYTMRPWLVRWEQAIGRDLVTEPDFFAEFNVDALLRGDIATRFAAYRTAIEAGFMTRQEVRRKENLKAIDGLDVPLRPLNMGNGAEPPAEDTAPPPGARRIEEKTPYVQ